MTCVCGSFRFTCPETCTWTANDCHCKRCNELRSNFLLKLNVSEEICPTRGATTLFRDLEVKNQLTSVSSNYPGCKLLFEGWGSYGKSRSNASEQSVKETCKEFSNPLSSDLPKTRSPKPISSSAKGKSSPLDAKRQSPCKNDQSDILPKAVHTAVCLLDIKASSNKLSSECAKSDRIYVREGDTAAQTDPFNPQDVLFRVLNNALSTQCTKVSSKSTYPAVSQKNVKLPTESKFTCKCCSAKGCAVDKRLSTQLVDKLLSDQNSKSETHQKGNYKSTRSKGNECRNWQSTSGISFKSESIQVKSSDLSRPSLGSGRSCGAGFSSRPTPYLQSSDKGRSSETSFSQQASSKQSSSVSDKPDPFALIGNLGIPQCFVDIDTMDLIFQKCVHEWNEKPDTDEDD